ncbi:DUF389 domain-containing protein [Streptosporangiaceae bacterium NEAU-GS5]|nr:DUF389 domain-containing protein [Streptosporangiaceae bacterium NEAU-GS5]
MLHLRVISPPERTEAALAALDGCLGVTNLIVLPGAAKRPAGDVLLFDVAREGANDALALLKPLGVSIAAENVDLSLSEGAERAEAETPGAGEDAVVWEQLAKRVVSDSTITWAFLVFMAIATQIAAIGVLNDSVILIVGAMVLGPEFGAVAGICFGLLRGDRALIRTASMTLLTGFAAGIAVTFACALVSRELGWVTEDMLNTNAEVHFIVTPDKWSVIVAVLAGAAGVLSITAGKSSSLVGVFISVTTVPAAGYLAVALALWRWEEVGGSLLQLGVNITGMILAGTTVLYLQRYLWKRVRLKGHAPSHPQG